MARTPSRRSYHHGDLRNALMVTARTLIRERRSIEFAMRELADGIGVTQPAIYRHFRGRDEILQAICLEGFALYDAAQDAEQATAGESPWGQLMALGRAHFLFALHHPDYFRVMFESGVPTQPDITPQVIPTYRKSVAAVEAGQAAGEIGPGEPGDIAIACWATWHGLATLFLNGPVADRPDRTARLLAMLDHSLAHGLKAGSALAATPA